MLDFNPILGFESYLKLQMLDWIILYMEEKLKENHSTLILEPKTSSAFKSLDFGLEFNVVFLVSLTLS